jgi:hypothetical protein
VEHTCSGAHQLHLAGAKGAAVAHAVFVLQGAFEHVAEDFHVPVRMHGESSAWSDTIFVDHAQRAKTHLRGIVVLREGEGVM